MIAEVIVLTQASTRTAFERAEDHDITIAIIAAISGVAIALISAVAGIVAAYRSGQARDHAREANDAVNHRSGRTDAAGNLPPKLYDAVLEQRGEIVAARDELRRLQLWADQVDEYHRMADSQRTETAAIVSQVARVVAEHVKWEQDVTRGKYGLTPAPQED